LLRRPSEPGSSIFILGRRAFVGIFSEKQSSPPAAGPPRRFQVLDWISPPFPQEGGISLSCCVLCFSPVELPPPPLVSFARSRHCIIHLHPVKTFGPSPPPDKPDPDFFSNINSAPPTIAFPPIARHRWASLPDPFLATSFAHLGVIRLSLIHSRHSCFPILFPESCPLSPFQSILA